MRRLFFCLPLIAVVLIVSCAGINTKQLRPGMTTQEVKALLGNPNFAYSGKVMGSNAHAWDYEKDTLGIPNPLDDYGWLVVPTTQVVRIWFVNGKLKQWQSGKFRSIESLYDGVKNQPEWSVPPNFNYLNSPNQRVR